MKKTIFASVVLSATLFFSACNYNKGPLKITDAHLAHHFVWGETQDKAPANDLVIYWQGKADSSVKISFYPLNTPAGSYETAEYIVKHPAKKILLKDFYKFWGVNEQKEFTYGLTIQQEADTATKSAIYPLQFKVMPR
ncbi:MAG: hypothetical protein C4308_09460 [Chitinophagaceae bacterium]